MSDTEIGALRAKLASRVRSDDYRQRRKDCLLYTSDAADE